MRITLTAVVLAALASPISAQFNQLGWTLDNSNGGIGNVNATNMDIHGLFAAFPGAIVKYTATAHLACRVNVHAVVMPEDGVCSGGGSVALTLVGPTNDGFANCNFNGDVQFDVPELQPFGFGLQTFNTAWPYSINLTNFSITPYWESLPGSLAGVSTPALGGLGVIQPGKTVRLRLAAAAPNAPFALVVGLSAANAPFKGGVLVPSPDVVIGGLITNGSGGTTLSSAWPTGLPAGFSFIAQAWIVDAAAPAGLSASNALKGTQL